MKIQIKLLLASIPIVLTFANSTFAAVCAHPCAVTSAGTFSEILLLSTGGNEWEIENFNGNIFQIGPNGGSTEPFRIDYAASENSIQLLTGGDISLANGDVYWDDSSNFFGIGTTTPNSALHIKTQNGNLILEGGTGVPYSKWAISTITGGGLSFQDVISGFYPFLIDGNIPLANTLRLTTTGIGMGTDAPAASLEVERSDGTAKVLVEELAGTVAKRRLMELSNNGAASMLFTNSDTGVSWELNPNGADNFIINSVGYGPGAEMLINKDTGNVNFKGTVKSLGVILTSSRETKEGFSPIDPMEILDSVASLDISEWQFKQDKEKQRHIGPMAEDFEAAFNLGTDGKTIGVTDVNGIALASIQALNQKLSDKEAQLVKANTRIQELIEQDMQMNKRLARLESLLSK